MVAQRPMVLRSWDHLVATNPDVAAPDTLPISAAGTPSPLTSQTRSPSRPSGSAMYSWKSPPK